MRHGLSFSDAGKLGAAQTTIVKREKKSKLVSEYEIDPARCVCCLSSMPYEKRKNKFCGRSCAQRFNNRGTVRNSQKAFGQYGNCEACEKVLQARSGRYCNNGCQGDARYSKSLRSWLSGENNGLTTNGVVNSTVKRYLREKFHDKCALCGWSEINPVTGKVPLVADHIDGNWQNNTEQNLRLLCGCCDSLQPTFGGLNRGNGRKNRRY